MLTNKNNYYKNLIAVYNSNHLLFHLNNVLSFLQGCKLFKDIRHYEYSFMKHFLHLSSRVINKLHIVEIIKQPNKYYVYLNNKDFSGFMFGWVGQISTNHSIIQVCEQNNKEDYDTITNFINNEKLN